MPPSPPQLYGANMVGEMTPHLGPWTASSKGNTLAKRAPRRGAWSFPPRPPTCPERSLNAHITHTTNGQQCCNSNQRVTLGSYLCHVAWLGFFLQDCCDCNSNCKLTGKSVLSQMTAHVTCNSCLDRDLMTCVAFLLLGEWSWVLITHGHFIARVLRQKHCPKSN